VPVISGIRKLTKPSSAFCLFLIVLAFFTSTASAEISELIGVSGDGNSIQAAAINNQLVFAHINKNSGALKFSEQTGNSWSEQTIANNVSASSELSLSVASGNPHLALVNPATGSLVYYTRNGTNWTSQTIHSSNVRGTPSIQVFGGEVLISYSSANTKDLMLARKISGTWTSTAVDPDAGDVGGESVIAVSNFGTAIAYLDSTNRRLKVAVSANRTNWALNTVSYPGAAFGRLPSAAWLSTGELSILSGDVVQDSRAGGQGVFHAQRDTNGAWEIEKVGHPAAPSQSGVLSSNDSNRTSGLVIRRWGVSSVMKVKRQSNGLWFGTTLATGANGEVFSDLTAVTLPSGEAHYFFKTSQNGDVIWHVSGEGTVQPEAADPSNPPTTPEPTPLPRSGVDSDEDGLSDAQEEELGSDPQTTDTDGDGVFDGQEVADGSDPLSSSSFLGSTENRLCTFFSDKSSVQQEVNVKNEVQGNLTYQLQVLSFSGELKTVDERIIAPKGSEQVVIDHLVAGSGLKKGQICIDFLGKAQFASGNYYEAKAGRATRGRRKASKYLLQHKLTSGSARTQKLSFKSAGRSKGEKSAVKLMLINSGAIKSSGLLKVLNSKGKVTSKFSVKVNANSAVEIKGSKLKLVSGSKIVWTPATGSLGVSLEQQVKKRVGKKFELVRLQRSDAK